jgi:hypothetical protein
MQATDCIYPTLPVAHVCGNSLQEFYHVGGDVTYSTSVCTALRDFRNKDLKGHQERCKRLVDC